MRIFVSALIPLLLAGVAPADVIIVRKGRKLDVVGMKDSVEVNDEKVQITPNNVELYADQSSGAILVDGYSGIKIAKNDRAKSGTFYARADIVKVVYSSEPAKLLDGIDNMRLAAYAQAIADFRDVMNDPNVREVFKLDARYRIGRCYLGSGNLAGCLSHYKDWPTVNSKYTPLVQDLVARINTNQKKYAQARAAYAAIGQLADITENWKYQSRLGAVRVDIAERKFTEAEQAAAAIAREARGKKGANDALVAAVTLQAEAIFRSGAADRLPEAQGLLDNARGDLEDVEPGTKAELYLMLGNVVYAQRKPDEARFPYMRAALMYEDTGYEGPGYTNAGLCYLDLAGKAANEGDQKKSDELFMRGMRLLGTAAGRYRQPDARKHYLKAENKTRFDKLKAKEDEEGGSATEEGK